MRWYGIDDLTPEEISKITATLKDMELESGMDGLYWLPAPVEMLSPVQKEHVKSCGPHVFGLEVEEDSLRMELLVRAKNRMRCDCVHYAGPELRASMIAWLEQMLTDLGITT
ncbi:MAG: hypothetical protein BCS36_03380 [Desulfovibrio sp. MES5]|uniref:hypothetical protein n=1 Tax=Desulfovibrio sp. MES5 TaxID=1899016 RepID=UPI000B9C8890|nr:hypothetical protein [Desulfovibrio sp. MES5]OXS29909.1 MAG: hypothetical protein BCS36_03380 [Desulfovibrio sp. MES5]